MTRVTAGRRRAEGRTDPPQPSRPGLVPCCVLSLGGSATGPFPHRPPQSTRPSREQEGDTDKAGAPAGGSMPMTEAEAVGRLHAPSRAGRALRPPSHARRHRAAEKSAAAPSPAGVWAQVTGLGARALCGAPGHPHVLPRCHATPPGERERTVRSRPAGHTRGVALPSAARESRRRELAGLLFWLRVCSSEEPATHLLTPDQLGRGPLPH